jgi:hypothetical protein
VSEFAPREEVPTEGAHVAPRVEQPLVPRVEQPMVFREDLPVPEPWSRTLWHVGKGVPLTLGMWYALQHYVLTDMHVSYPFIMTGLFAVQGVFERRKGMFNSQQLLITGGVVAGASLILLADGVLGKDKTTLVVSVVLGALGVLALIAGYRARALENERAARLANSAPVEGAMPVATLRSRLQIFRERVSKFNRRLIAGFVGVLGGTFGGLTLAELYTWPEWAEFGLFGFFWVGILGSMWYGAHLTARVARESDLTCPACARPMIGSIGVSARLLSQLEDLGRCPQCAARITQEVL